MPIPFPDFQSLLDLYAGLPEHAKIVVGAAGEFVLAETFGKWWKKARPEERGGVFAPIYREWRDSLLESEVSDEKLAQAFEEFFCRPPVRRELDKVLHGRFRDVDYQVLRQQLHDSCELVDCPVPGGGLVTQIDLWVRSLKTLLEQDPEYQAKFQPLFRESLSQSENSIHNDSLARELYLKDVEERHRHIRFSGIAPIGGNPDTIELVKIFVMPDVLEQLEFNEPSLEKAEPAPACALLTQANGPRRAVILGGPGSGKTTLLQSLCFGFTAGGRARFTWAHGLPELLPVFYRIRELEEDLGKHTTIWDCIAHRCSHNLGSLLPAGFFLRQMESAGLMIFFDGLDETKTAASRTDLVQLIESFVRGLSRECRVVVTSRPYEYRRRFIAVDRHFQLREFSDDQIQQFIGGWQHVHVPDHKAAREKGDRLWKALQARSDILPLARNALLLTMIVRVHFGMGVLPESRVSLYAKCSETLLEDWWKAAGFSGSALGLSDKEGFLSQLAFDMQTEFGEKLAGMGEGTVLQLGRKEPWLRLLVEYLSRYYWLDSEQNYSLGPSAKECAEACIGHKQTIPTLQAMFEPSAREGQSLAAAVELAEALAGLGSSEAQAILDGFFRESADCGLDSAQDMAQVDGFLLDKYLVTNQQYERMIPGHGKMRDDYSHADNQPVIYVNWFEARLFCRWRGTGFRLPTEEEWYRAAAGEDKREYPWGNEFDPSRCNTWDSGPKKTTSVGAYPDGVSPYGCYDMAGNVWEWSESKWGEGNENRVLRGGAWYGFSGFAACSCHSHELPRYRYDDVGFRCARTYY